MSGDQLQADVSKLKRICLRLDNGTRIGFPSALGIDSAAKVVKLDFVEGFSRGIVSEADLNRISEIAGQLETQRLAAAAPGTKAKVRACPNQLPLQPALFALAAVWLCFQDTIQM
jgi:hypothetical protein